MPDDPGSNSPPNLQPDPSPPPVLDQATIPSSLPPRGWNRSTRIHLLLWIAIAFVVPGLIIFAMQHGRGWNNPEFTIQSEFPAKAIASFFVCLATWLMSRLEKRPLDDYGIPLRQAFGKRFWEGTLWGFAMLSAVVLILRATGHFRIDSVALTGMPALRYALGWAAVFLAVSISEEFAFRGYWLFAIARRTSFWRAALVLSLGFAAAHLANPGENLIGILQVFAIALLFCLTIRRTGNLWFVLGFHAAWDWAETFFYGTADSGIIGVGHFLNSSTQGPAWLTGGAAGPEGSIIVLIVLLLCAILIHFRFPRIACPDHSA